VNEQKKLTEREQISNEEANEVEGGNTCTLPVKCENAMKPSNHGLGED